LENSYTGKISGVDAIFIESYATVAMLGDSKYTREAFSSYTVEFGRQEQLPVWILLVSIFGGLIILTLITYGLKKVVIKIFN